MQSGRIIEYGLQADSVLTQKHGDIFAVFSNSVYLHANDKICCLGTDKLVKGPINIATDLAQIGGLSVGDPWVYTNKALTLGNHYRLGTDKSICRKRCNRISTDIPNQTDLINLPVCISIIEQSLLNHSTRINSRNSDDTTGRLVETQLQQYSSLLEITLQQSVSACGVKEIPISLTGIIGCGDGLTPAGDDILVGALTTLHYFNTGYTQLREWVIKHAPDRTNRISLAHLMAACDGQAVDLVHDVLDTISPIDRLENRHHLHSASVEKLADYGHSSGYFALNGILIALKAQRDTQSAL